MQDTYQTIAGLVVIKFESSPDRTFVSSDGNLERR